MVTPGNYVGQLQSRVGCGVGGWGRSRQTIISYPDYNGAPVCLLATYFLNLTKTRPVGQSKVGSDHFTMRFLCNWTNTFIDKKCSGASYQDKELCLGTGLVIC